MECYAYHRGAQDKRFYLVMELLQGPNLEQVLKQEGPFREARAVEIISACLEGLGAIHSNRLVHRDIKLNNVVLHLDTAQTDTMRETFNVGPIWHQREVPSKPLAWIQKNKPGEGWCFTGKWYSADGTSYCVFERLLGTPLCNQPVCKLIDFGMAKGTRDPETGEPLHSEGMMTESNKVMGTPEYMSPEMWSGVEKVSFTSLIYQSRGMYITLLF